MKINLHIVCTTWLVVCWQMVSAQQFLTQHINFTKGLSSNTVWGMTQDNQGYIWLATSNGVDRFDGHSFKFISRQDGLANTEVMDFFSNPVTGEVYAQFYAGKLAVLKDGAVDTLKSKRMVRFFSKRKLVNITVNARQKTLFIYGDQYIWETDFDFKLLRSFAVQQRNGYLQLLFYRASDCFGFLKTAAAELSLIRVLDGRMLPEKSFPGVRIPQVKFNSVNGKSCLLFDQHNVIYSFNFESLALMPLACGETEISGLHLDSDSVLWYGKNDGVNWIDLKDSCSKGHLLKGHIVGNIFEDRWKQIWISTITNGVYLISQKNIRKKDLSFLKDPTQPIQYFYKDSNFTIYGFSNNGFGWQRGTTYQEVRFSPNEIYNRLLGMVLNDSAHLLVHDFGVFDFRAMRSCLEGRGVKQFAPIGNGLYAGAGLNGLITYRMHGGTFTAIDTLVKTRVLAFASIGDTSLIYYTAHGQYVIHLKSRRTEPVTCTLGRVPGITCYYSKSSKIYGVADDGIIYQLAGTVLHPAVTGLFSENESIRRIFIDQEGTLHAVSDRSYAALQDYEKGKRSGKLVLNYKNGLSHTLINDLFVYKDTVYISGNDGVLYFRRKDMANRFPDQLFLSQISSGAESIITRDRYFILRNNQTDLKIDFHTIDFSFPEQVVYEYRLMRNDKDRAWSKTTGNSILFSDLKSGDYVFQIFAHSRSDLKQATPLVELRFSKEPLLMENSLILALLNILLLAGGVGVVQVLIQRKTRIDKKNQLVQQRITQLELMALRSQLDPHFIFNSLNSIKDFIRKNDHEGSQQYLDDFSLLMRLTLDKSKSKNILLSDEINYLDKYLKLEKLRYNHRFRYNIHRQDVPAELIFIPSMMLQPFVENAIRHGLIGSMDYEGRLDLYFEMPDENYLRCLILDNGVGLQAGKVARPGEVHAVDILKDRISLYNASKLLQISFNIDNRTDGSSGVCVEILLPILYHEND